VRGFCGKVHLYGFFCPIASDKISFFGDASLHQQSAADPAFPRLARSSSSMAAGLHWLIGPRRV
jgi:hypothetical protein